MLICRAETIGEEKLKRSHVPFSLMYMKVKSHRLKMTDGELEALGVVVSQGLSEWWPLNSQDETGAWSMDRNVQVTTRGECADFRSLGMRVFLPCFVTKKRKAFR